MLLVLEKTLESPLNSEEIKPVNAKGNQSWIFIGRTNAEAETPKLWPPDLKNWLIWKDPDAVKDWGQEKGTTEDEMVGWHHRLNGREFEYTLGVGDGQGRLAYCSPWGHKEWLHVTKPWLNNWTETWLLIHLGFSQSAYDVFSVLSWLTLFTFPAFFWNNKIFYDFVLSPVGC